MPEALSGPRQCDPAEEEYCQDEVREEGGEVNHLEEEVVEEILIIIILVYLAGRRNSLAEDKVDNDP